MKLSKMIPVFVVGCCLMLSVQLQAGEIKLKDFKVKAKHEGTSEELFGYNEDEGRIFMYVHALAETEVDIKEAGTYKITLDASGEKGKKDYPKFKLSVGDTVIEKEFELKKEDSETYSFKADLKLGKQKLVIEFLNDEYEEGQYDSNLYVYKVTMEK